MVGHFAFIEADNNMKTYRQEHRQHTDKKDRHTTSTWIEKTGIQKSHGQDRTIHGQHN